MLTEAAVLRKKQRLERLEASKKRMRELQDEVASATAAAMATEAPTKARKVSLLGLYSTGYSTACILSYFLFWKKILDYWP